MDEQLARIREAYDLTLVQYRQGIDPLAHVPEAFKNSPEFRAFMEGASQACSSDAPENKAYLNPQPGMRFLDGGCCANLANYRLDRWPSMYYGVDISPALVEAMRGFAAQHQLSIGGLHVAEIADLPFDNGFFDMAAVIGVLEYCTIEYIERVLQELRRVLKPQARVVLDIPNLDHPQIEIMLELEQYLGRPTTVYSRRAFEKVLKPLFAVERVDDSQVMLKYFCRVGK